MAFELSDATLCAHAGLPHRQTPRISSAPETHAAPLWQASVYDFRAIEESVSSLDGCGYAYRRGANPNADELAAAVVALEGGESGIATATGMGAITVAVLSVCSSGDCVLSQPDPYGGTVALLTNDLKRFGIQVQFRDITQPDQLEAALLENLPSCGYFGDSNAARSGPNEANPTANDSERVVSSDSAVLVGEGKERGAAGESAVPEIGGERQEHRRCAVMVETISNPLLREADVGALSALCRRFGAVLIVDNTFATPLRCKPLKEGANLVVHSVTKFLGGHSDLMAGAVVGSRAAILPAQQLANRMGLLAAPLDAWLAVRGIKTLQIRMERSWRTALALAMILERHENIIRVYTTSMCSVISFEVQNGFAGANAAVKAFKMITLSPSLGGVVTTVSHSATSSNKSQSAEERLRLGVTDGLLRMSVGLEAVDDIWRDLDCGIKAAAKSVARQ